MQIALTGTEFEDVLTALDHRLHAMREELVHTDDRELREGLRADLERVEKLRERLGDLTTE